MILRSAMSGLKITLLALNKALIIQVIAKNV